LHWDIEEIKTFDSADNSVSKAFISSEEKDGRRNIKVRLLTINQKGDTIYDTNKIDMKDGNN
jgi:hypothetical protein